MKCKILMIVLSFAISLTLFSDDIDKMKPQDVLKKSCQNSISKKGFHYNYETAEVNQQKFTLKGIFNSPDLFSFSGNIEGFKKGKTAVIKDDKGNWTTTNKIKDKPEVDIINNFNPKSFLMDVSKATAIRFSDTDEEINSVACKVIEATGKSDKIKEYAHNLKDVVKNFVGMQVDITGYIDYKKSTVSYKIYVCKDDFLIYCIKQTVDVKLKEGIPNLGNLAIPQSFTFTDSINYSDYEKEITIEIPQEAKKIIGMK